MHIIFLAIQGIPGACADMERCIAMLRSIFHFLWSWRRYNTSLRQLSHLDDRQLADIGISRSDIPRAAWDAADH